MHLTQVKDQTATNTCFKAKTLAIEINQASHWVILEKLKYLLNDKGGDKNMEDLLNIKKLTILYL